MHNKLLCLINCTWLQEFVMALKCMRAAESPNTPFTVLYERFETGMYAINPLTTYFYVCMFI